MIYDYGQPFQRVGSSDYNVKVSCTLYRCYSNNGLFMFTFVILVQGEKKYYAYNNDLVRQ